MVWSLHSQTRYKSIFKYVLWCGFLSYDGFELPVSKKRTVFSVSKLELRVKSSVPYGEPGHELHWMYALRQKIAGCSGKQLGKDNKSR